MAESAYADCLIDIDLLVFATGAVDLRCHIDAGNLFELTADAEDLAKLYEVFDALFLENIHKGEREAHRMFTQKLNFYFLIPGKRIELNKSLNDTFVDALYCGLNPNKTS